MCSIATKTAVALASVRHNLHWKVYRSAGAWSVTHRRGAGGHTDNLPFLDWRAIFSRQKSTTRPMPPTKRYGLPPCDPPTLEKLKRMDKDYKWIGEPIKELDGHLFFQAVQLSADGPIVKLGDSVELESGSSQMPWLAQVTEMWQEARSGLKRMRALWYYFPKSVLDKGVSYPEGQPAGNEIMSSDHLDAHFVFSIKKPCVIVHALNRPRTFRSGRCLEDATETETQLFYKYCYNLSKKRLELAALPSLLHEMQQDTPSKVSEGKPSHSKRPKLGDASTNEPTIAGGKSESAPVSISSPSGSGRETVTSCYSTPIKPSPSDKTDGEIRNDSDGAERAGQANGLRNVSAKRKVISLDKEDFQSKQEFESTRCELQKESSEAALSAPLQRTKESLPACGSVPISGDPSSSDESAQKLVKAGLECLDGNVCIRDGWQTWYNFKVECGDNGLNEIITIQRKVVEDGNLSTGTLLLKGGQNAKFENNETDRTRVLYVAEGTATVTFTDSSSKSAPPPATLEGADQKVSFNSVTKIVQAGEFVHLKPGIQMTTRNEDSTNLCCVWIDVKPERNESRK